MSFITSAICATKPRWRSIIRLPKNNVVDTALRPLTFLDQTFGPGKCPSGRATLRWSKSAFAKNVVFGHWQSELHLNLAKFMLGMRADPTA